MHTDKAIQQALREQKARVESEEVYTARTFKVRRDTYEHEGKLKRWDIIVHPGAVVLVPVLKNGHLLLVKQWRRASGKILLEFPAGTLEEGEIPVDCAQRELREETGYRADRILPMGGFYSAPGFCTEFLHLFLALDLEEAPLQTEDEDEEIDLIDASFEEVEAMIEKHQIEDAKTIAGFYRYDRWLKTKNL
jgi:ADP-ribose pyrophosphatase